MQNLIYDHNAFKVRRVGERRWCGDPAVPTVTVQAAAEDRLRALEPDRGAAAGADGAQRRPPQSPDAEVCR